MIGSMKRLDYAIGSFVPAALHIKKSVQDPEIQKINMSLPALFQKNGMQKSTTKITVKTILKALVP